MWMPKCTFPKVPSPIILPTSTMELLSLYSARVLFVLLLFIQIFPERLIIVVFIIMIEQGETQLKFEAALKANQYQPSHEEQTEIAIDPLFCALNIFTKILPIIAFFVFSDYKIFDFTAVLLSASIDFWLSKNIIGRKLVGMTWWMKINEQTGEEVWIFHSTDCENISSMNYNIFWSCILGSSIFWGFSTLLSILISRLFWVSICAVCFILSAINLTFYLRCRGNHQEKFKGIADKMGIQSAHALVGDY